ncbi:MAG: DEAD/DEAH box helicase [Polyangiales bacterium]
MPLTFLPEREGLCAWGEDAALRAWPALLEAAAPSSARLVTPDGLRDVDGQVLPLLATAAQLAAVPAAELGSLRGSMASWALASKLAFELVAHEQIVPTITRVQGRIEARWAAALVHADAAAKLDAIARSMPPAAHAVPIGRGDDGAVWSPHAATRAYVDAVVDALVRAARGGPELPTITQIARAKSSQAAANGGRVDARARTAGSGVGDRRAAPLTPSSAPDGWNTRWARALTGEERGFEARGFGERTVVDDLAHWSEAALGARDRLRACFRLELPVADGDMFRLSFWLQSPEDPSLIVPATEVWQTQGRTLERLGRAFRDPQESLLEALGRAVRVWPPLSAALAEAKPEGLALDPAAAWAFLGDGAGLLGEAGFGVIVPSELTAAGQRRLRLRMKVGGQSRTAGVVSGVAGLDMDTLLHVDWEAVIGDESLSARELAALAAHKAPLVRYRGAWVAIDPGELGEIRKRVAGGSAQVQAREVLQAVLAGEVQTGQLKAAVSAGGVLAELLERVRDSGSHELPPPAQLQAVLRPYQARGLHWLACMADLGLGACLADDMGLGKTIQLLAFLLHRLAQRPDDSRPALLIAPTSVIGNWEREAQRFAPTLTVVRHYGERRAEQLAALSRAPGTLVITTYGLLRRDAVLLGQVDWSVVALDEAQNIKNSASATAQAARALPAAIRFALTGTPVENRLAELWSIMEFANPGLLGPLPTFRREIALPIERYGNEAAATRLRKVVSPFVLRRRKSDPAVISDLPAKHEMKVVCTLTREQASLYKAVVDEELRRIDAVDGMERRGRVLALLTFTKQVCNHPAQYLGERGPLPQRSGKLARITEMLEEAVAAQDKALVFTQFRDMGDKLVAHLREQLGCEVLFLHGGTPRSQRDELVRRFQEEAPEPRIFVLSVKAGGTGLNLTAASHVFHYDRWWNPAVEDQATDRAYRIGQKRAVQVHKLLCAGTVEERIDQLLEQKRELADKIVGSGEHWITELGSQELRELFALSDGAVAPDEEGASAADGGAKPKRKRGVRKELTP